MMMTMMKRRRRGEKGRMGGWGARAAAAGDEMSAAAAAARDCERARDAGTTTMMMMMPAREQGISCWTDGATSSALRASRVLLVSLPLCLRLTMGKGRRVCSAFKWQIPFHEFLDARRDLLVLSEADVIRGILS